MRALVTGASGFVGGYLLAALQREGAETFGCGGPHDAGDFFPLDLLDESNVRAALDLARPDVVFHLAAQTFVPESLASPIPTYETNAIGVARLMQALRGYASAGNALPRLLFTSSAEVYGPRFGKELPVRETASARPANPYAASKAAAEAIVVAEAQSFKMDVVVTRAFNHIGPGQSDRFVVASFATQLARVAARIDDHLLVGNLEAARDFLDVRDVVDAYVRLARDGASGEVYNVCSGNAVKIRDVLGELIRIAGVPVEVREDRARMRPADVPVFVGSHEKVTERTGWVPKVSLERSLREIYAAAAARAGNPARGS